MQLHTDPASRDSDLRVEASRWLDSAIEPHAGTVTFVGVGLGHALDLLERTHPQLRAIVFEPNPAVAAALRSRRDWTNWTATGRLAILVGPDYAGASEMARSLPDLSHAPTLVYPPLQRESPAEAERAAKALQRLIFSTSANEAARRASAGRYLLHTLANLPRIAREGDAGSLAGVLPRIPALIVAAGPSLDRNVHDLARVRDRAVVISCDTAARPLLTLGVEPDFIVGSDPSRANAAHLSSLPPARSWLAAEASLHPSAFTHFDRRTFMFRVAPHEPWPWLDSIGLGRACLDTWGSVASSAFTLALSLGCDPIVFLGADFAFSDGRPYCRGTSFEPVWASWVSGGATYDEVWRQGVERWPEVVERDISGHSVRTAPHLIAFRDWIVERASASAPRRIVNATGAGILSGTAIAQCAATETLAASPVLDLRAVHERIRHAHGTTRSDLSRVFAAVTEVIAGGPADPREAWMAFTQASVTAPAIAAALQSHEYSSWMLGRGGARPGLGNAL